MLTKKRRKEINQHVIRLEALVRIGMTHDTELNIMRDLIAHIEEMESENRIIQGWINYELPQVCEQHEVKLVIKKGRLCCPKGHEINVG